MQSLLILALALLACANAFVSTGSKHAFGTHLFSECTDKLKDAKGRCPGDAGYIPLLKEAPKSFADFQKENAAKKAGGEVDDGRCAAKLRDAKGKCPGDAGYIPLMKEAPKSFADFQKEAAAKKAAGK